MNNSATTNRVEQRKLATSSHLSSVSRRLTAERGLAGFTIEEVCDEVGVSRRTFFNYFPSKEEAVLGVDESEEMRVVSESFLALGPRGWSAVVDDFIELAVEHVRLSGLDADEHRILIAAIDREPRLLARFIGMGRERELQLAELIAARENVSVDDVHVRAVVNLIATLLRSTGESLLETGSAENFGVALHESLAAVRAVLDISLPREAQQ
jgi:AcrR family transcriptional regulator